MKRLLCVVVAMLCCGIGLVRAADWTTDGGDTQRSGWQKDEHILTTSNVKNMKILWKVETGNQPRALHGLMPALVVEKVSTASGVKQIVLVSGISDNLYAMDAASGAFLWKKHFDHEQPAGPAMPPELAGILGGRDPAHLNFLNPGGSSDTPVIGPADPNGKRPVYFVDGGGMLHVLNLADGEDLKPPVKFATGKAWALNLVGNTLFMPIGSGTLHAMDLTDPEANDMSISDGSGGLWGRRGPAVDSTGTAWTTTGDGVYDPKTDKYGNSIMGIEVVQHQLRMKDYYTPTNWEWLQKRDLDPNNTPTIFTYKGRELLAASGKECRVFLLDPKSAGGADHQTPLYRTEPFCNEAVDFQDNGSWGALSSWEDSKGTRWVIAPFWGPVHSQFKFPSTNAPAPVKGGVAAFKVVEVGGKPQLGPVWVSRDMDHGEPVVIANGIVFTFGSGDFTQQASPEHGLDFDSSIRAGKASHVTLYALDAETGKELYSSRDQIPMFNHFSGLSVANGHVYISTYGGTLYCFGLDQH
jgi:outer membrane protein assembly factor BamB